MTAPNRPPDCEIVMAGYRPPSLNDYVRAHWRKRSKMVAIAMQLIFADLWTKDSVNRARAIKPDVKRIVEIEITNAGRDRDMDHDNAQKIILDAIVRNGLLRDDSAKWCSSFVTFRRGSARATRLKFWNV